MKRSGMILLLAWLLVACNKDKALLTDVNCEGSDPSFSNDLIPLFEKSCATGGATGCHDSWIFSHSNVESKVKSGAMEYRVIVLEDMPPANNTFNIDPLTEDEKKLIHCWMANGAQDN